MHGARWGLPNVTTFVKPVRIVCVKDLDCILACGASNLQNDMAIAPVYLRLYFVCHMCQLVSDKNVTVCSYTNTELPELSAINL